MKRFVISMLTAALLLSTAASALALAVNDLASLEADGVAIEAIVPMAQNIVATTYTSTGLNINNGEFWISAGYLLDYRSPGSDVVIPEGVTEIATGYAFREAVNKDKITSATILSTLSRVAQGTFLGCTSLKQVTILGDNAEFYGPCFAIGYDRGYMYNNDLTIRCGAGSTGEAYAEKMGFNVEIIDTSAYNQAEETTVTTETVQPTTTPTTATTQSATTVVDPEGYKYFPDVKNGAWYAEAVNAMAKPGIINGCDDGLFHPNDTLTEGEWAALQAQPGYKTWTLEDIPDHEVIEYNFCDTSLANETYIEWAIRDGTWALVAHSWEPEWIVEAYNERIIQGKDGGVCDPLGTLTRAEAAQILYNAGLTYRSNIHTWWCSGWDIRPVE